MAVFQLGRLGGGEIDRHPRLATVVVVHGSAVVVCLYHRGRDTAALGYLPAVLGRPLPDRLIGVPAGRPGHRCCGPSTGGAAGAGRHCQVRFQRFAQLGDVLVRQVDGVGDAVQPELDGTVGVAAVQVVGENGDELTSH